MTRQESLVTVCVPTRHSSNYQEFPIYVGTPDFGYRTGPDRHSQRNRPEEQGSAQHHSLPTLVLTLCALGGSGRGGYMTSLMGRFPHDNPKDREGRPGAKLTMTCIDAPFIAQRKTESCLCRLDTAYMFK